MLALYGSLAPQLVFLSAPLSASTRARARGTTLSVCAASLQGAACLVDMVCRAPALRALIADGNKLGDDGINALAVRRTVDGLVLRVSVPDSSGNTRALTGACPRAEC